MPYLLSSQKEPRHECYIIHFVEYFFQQLHDNTIIVIPKYFDIVTVLTEVCIG